MVLHFANLSHNYLINKIIRKIYLCLKTYSWKLSRSVADVSAIFIGSNQTLRCEISHNIMQFTDFYEKRL